ncbi:protein NEGATIVE REGULATOR OF RESISTANCE-like [Nicotiana tomentosiformis]|uniref:protein NEGATIVE REGULATOR OF RESISTANCE-like n=1 Tax=Nicotiana tomentosiformis TaxID=4098 RepID=UPI000878DF45|nr:protein NEGATIVE REGULATOR OF RESISTANCE-like [Nicotiana tomentosiformis]
MEVQKRKCSVNGEIEAKKQKKTAKDDGRNKAAVAVAEAEDDEMEEFYAILRRIRAAVKYFEKGNAGGVSDRKMTAGTPWNLTFRPEDFQEVDGVKVQDRVESNATLDLNADPNEL